MAKKDPKDKEIEKLRKELEASETKRVKLSEEIKSMRAKERAERKKKDAANAAVNREQRAFLAALLRDINTKT